MTIPVAHWSPFLHAPLTPHTALAHLPSWMHTLMRRTAPPLALARNCLSSGVITSVRNMAGQRRFPPARDCNCGLNRGKKTTVHKNWSPTAPGQNKKLQSSQTDIEVQCLFRPLLLMMTPRLILTAGEEDDWLCLDSMSVCDSVRRDIAQVTRTVSCAHRERGNLITSLPNLAPTDCSGQGAGLWKDHHTPGPSRRAWPADPLTNIRDAITKNH